ncbi:serpin-ZXA [Ziziphus jujuba]|uniref:Serpin-ZXA n=1 Tax=Ziziphus jujuba TaxID=326968 RepID=A0A6P6G3H2_ZIZJJ|nr:serpin-ZXA [Ziziphus jujuba]
MENLDCCLLLTNKILENKAAKGSNSVASPLSSHVMLSLIAAGSKGQTLQQLLHFLGSNSVADLNLSSSKFISLASPAKILFGCPLLSFVNGAWLDQRFTLKSSFQKIVKGSYKAELKSVDFVTKAEKVVEEVNLWAETSTRGLIKQLLPNGSLNRETALVVANALYFKGVWERKFETSMTQLREFHLLNGQTVKCFRFPYQTGQDARKISMYIFLPNQKDGLLNLIQTVKLSPGFLNQRFELRLVDIPDFYIPKFKFCFEFEASKTMKEMGLKLPFKPGELTEMGTKGSESDKLYVLDIFHKSFIEVNEEGTEAASTTALCLKSCRSVIRLSFVAEHPFLFMIREETHGMVFFVGAVLNPLPDA